MWCVLVPSQNKVDDLPILPFLIRKHVTFSLELNSMCHFIGENNRCNVRLMMVKNIRMWHLTQFITSHLFWSVLRKSL